MSKNTIAAIAAQSAAAAGIVASLTPAPAPEPEPAARRTYLVDAIPVNHNGEHYPIGAEIELSEAEARSLAGAVSLKKES